MSFLLHDPLLRPLDEAGAIMPLCYMQFYESETTTPTPIYSDADLDNELTNPVVSDSAGIFPSIYGDSSVVYRRQLYDADDNLISDTDPMHPHVSVPAGTVWMFNGDSTARDAAFPPSLWQWHNGTNGTIDLRDRHPVGASATKVTGNTGGTSPGGTVTTSSDGDHDHGGTVSDETLTEAQGGVHRHFLFVNTTGTGTVDASAKVYKNSNSGGDSEYSLDGTSGTDATVGLSGASDGGDPHAHDITEGGAHTHEVTVASPPWGAYWFMQRRA